MSPESSNDTPVVRGNELKSIRFVRSRNPSLRLDVAPFYAIYPATVLALLGSAVSGNGYKLWQHARKETAIRPL